jgi:hypothetical protein
MYLAEKARLEGCLYAREVIAVYAALAEMQALVCVHV